MIHDYIHRVQQLVYDYNISFSLYLGSVNISPSLVMPLINEMTCKQHTLQINNHDIVENF